MIRNIQKAVLKTKHIFCSWGENLQPQTARLPNRNITVALAIRTNEKKIYCREE